MMSAKILLKILIISVWLSLAFGLSQSDKFEKLKKQVEKLEVQNQDVVLHPPTSCSALLKEHPSTPSGMYYINPQELSSSPLVQVYCDMTSKNGVGVTVIGHDSGSKTLVKGYDPPGSYKRNIKYDISMEQILAIMNQSGNCEQFIKYKCFGSVLLYTTIPYGWWVSRQGSQMNYWGGAAVNSGKCACGMTNSCAGGGKCNCDKNECVWREDSGYLTDKNTLPVTQLRFGDTGGTVEKGYHTLGKLRCWDIARFHRVPSCSALLIKHPSTRSGMYYLNPQGLSSSPLVQVYCDMTSKNDVGVTVIGHDSGSRTLVNGYDPPGSYKRNIKYDISMEQILAIMGQSKNCEQFIKYECYNTVLLYTTIPYGWWVSRQGSQMNYWGGAAVNSGKCACGMTNSCAGGGKCNCDKNDSAWREDSGYLTDKNTLPVTELRFGDTGNAIEKGYYTLGKLRCWS